MKILVYLWMFSASAPAVPVSQFDTVADCEKAIPVYAAKALPRKPGFLCIEW